MGKETVDMDILVTSRNGDRKIMQSIRITSRYEKYPITVIAVKTWNKSENK